MIISKVHNRETIYFQLHAEQVINSLVDKGGIGIAEKQLTLSCWDKIIEDCTINDYKNNTLVFNFEGIESCQNNSMKKISHILGLSKSVIFTNVVKKIVNDIGLDIFQNVNHVHSTNDENRYDIFYLSNNANDEVECNTQLLFTNAFQEKLIKYLDNNNNELIYHHSSSVYLTQYIDIKKFISHDKEMFIYAIYQLAIKINNHWNISNSELKPILICQNLNSSFIASLLSGLCKMDILILDKIGPINKLYSVLDKKIDESAKYIVVSDLVCLGTEIKVTKNLIEFLGGKYCGNVSIIRIETIYPKHKEFRDTECVLTINNENNNIFGYKILTALNA